MPLLFIVAKTRFLTLLATSGECTPVLTRLQEDNVGIFRFWYNGTNCVDSCQQHGYTLA